MHTAWPAPIRELSKPVALSAADRAALSAAKDNHLAELAGRAARAVGMTLAALLAEQLRACGRKAI